jgi:hypothetical protein
MRAWRHRSQILDVIAEPTSVEDLPDRLADLEAETLIPDYT